MTTALIVSVVWLTLGWVVAILVGRAVNARDRQVPRETPPFRFGSGPLAGVGLHTARPWVKR